MTTTKERPITCAADEVRAIFRGATQLRRIMKPQPQESFSQDYGSDGEPTSRRSYGVMWEPKAGDCWFNVDRPLILKYCPYGQTGDRLWVKETFRPLAWSSSEDGWGEIGYAAGGERQVDGPWTFDQAFPHGKSVDRWRPSIHMPRWASRITLEITEVRVEPLNEISEKDALADGGWTYGSCPFHKAPEKSFAHLWESIDGKGSWDLNPFVWAITFKRIEATP